ncbi:MAG TPA: FAD/NAD(P)-binding protein [Phycisphaerae bacterium]|nr:FAD/NAD(P)-binding protein [Phycisphaerae bacterium]
MTQSEIEKGAKADSPYLPRMGRIVAAEQMTETERFFRIEMDGDPLRYEPGQFVGVTVFGVGEAPISICSSPTQGDAFELTVRSVGLVTNALKKFEKGDRLGIRGPFGNHFDYEAMRGQDVLFVAGGLGLAPTRSLIRYCLDKRSDFGKVTILVGAREPSLLLFRQELQEWVERSDADTRVTVDRRDKDWKGDVGVITRLFRHIEIDPARTYALIVGPPVMFKFAVLEALASGVPEHRIICSLERHMKCGVGKCGHCQIRGIYVCREGPVFTYEQVKLLREGI